MAKAVRADVCARFGMTKAQFHDRLREGCFVSTHAPGNGRLSAPVTRANADDIAFHAVLMNQGINARRSAPIVADIMRRRELGEDVAALIYDPEMVLPP